VLLVRALVLGVAALCVFAADRSLAQSDGQDLASDLANPISSLISVPFQANYDENFGADEQGEVWRINIQPVIPLSLNDDWNVISRTIVPILEQDDVPTSGLDESGLGDTLQSFFLSPVDPTEDGWIWGAGPALLLPTASHDRLGADQWGLGPTAVVLRQSNSWTYGVLANHIESIAGDDDRADVSATFVQPFVSYITKSHTTFSLNFESTYDWESDEACIPINLTVQQLLKVGSQPIQVGVGLRYHVDSPDAGAERWGVRLQVTLLLPR
jgi:hypothetical protein